MFHHDGSPYWSWVKSEENEPLEGNPDKASEAMYKARTEEELLLRRNAEAVVKRLKRVISKQEKTIVKLLQDGYNQSEIADKLAVSEGTVNKAVFRIRQKSRNLANGNAGIGV